MFWLLLRSVCWTSRFSPFLHSSPSVSRLQVPKKLGGGKTRAAETEWWKGYPMPYKPCSAIKFWCREAGKRCSDLVEDITITDIESAQEIGHCGLWFKELVFTLDCFTGLYVVISWMISLLLHRDHEENSVALGMKTAATGSNAMNVLLQEQDEYKGAHQCWTDLNENCHLCCYAWPIHSYKTDMVLFSVKAMGILLHSICKHI